MAIAPQAPPGQRVPAFLELEITEQCQLTCPKLCYAKAGPKKGHGSLSTADWKSVMSEAAELGVQRVQFIGGEPTLHPHFEELIHHALHVGLDVQVYTNLYSVTSMHWRWFAHPRVSLGTSYYSDVAEEHDRVTGRPGSHAATRANIQLALEKNIRVQVGVVGVFDGQRITQAREELVELGVARVNLDHVRSVGRAEVHPPSQADLCGRCADARAAVMGDGTVVPCVLGRFLPTGNARDDGLAAVFDGQAWKDVAASIPRAAVGCPPADSNDCSPANTPACDPAYD
ncbi:MULTISPECIES: radical SAM protein [unclassified Streptomyces]|uniref:radical SAM/SPASM domain-containing protein n=1 Tax=unclassified Streptomyces TaxID=2593676 RepID=UPI000DBA71D1|nr:MULTISPECIES: radical SAM protein [unclassified Streptomyces]MYT68216.1 radical SAM protein [Streptomyces sp. SID8367]RAJ76848.1 radical SAM family protein [Streptomyces sp. PsTaAH-137]